MTRDVYVPSKHWTATIYIDSDYITLNGNGHLVESQPPRPVAYGVFIPNTRTGVRIENLTIRNFAWGIFLFYSANPRITKSKQ